MFKQKNKTGCETPKFRRSTVPPQYNPPPMPPVKPPKQKENKTMYGLKLYISYEYLDAYIREHVETADQYPAFIPVKAEVTEHDLGVEISLVSAVPNEFYGHRYRLDLNKLPKENDECKD